MGHVGSLCSQEAGKIEFSPIGASTGGKILFLGCCGLEDKYKGRRMQKDSAQRGAVADGSPLR